MTILAVAPERVFLDSENNIDPSPALASTTYARNGMAIESVSEYGQLDFADQTGDVWAHYRMDNVLSFNTSALGNFGAPAFLDNGSTSVVQLVASGGNLQVRINDATLVDTGLSDTTLETGSEQVVDMRANVTTGAIDLYIDGTLEWSSTETLTATEIASVRFGGTGDVTSHLWEFIVADESTVGWRLGIKYATAAGNYTAQTSGLFSDIDEVDPDTADKLVFSTASTRASFATNTPPAVGGSEEIKGIVLAWSAQKTATGPNQLTPFIRSSSTDTDGSAVALTSSWANGRHIFTTGLDKDCEIGVLAETV